MNSTMRMIFTYLAFLGLSFAPGTMISQTAPQGALEERMDALMIEISGRRDTLEIMKYEVTNALWVEVMGEALAADHACPDCPKTEVNLADIAEFVEILNSQVSRPFRLMTHIEFFAVSSYANQYPGYAKRKRSKMKDVAWIRYNSKGALHSVGQKQPNDAGIYDLVGNAAERTSHEADSMMHGMIDGQPVWKHFDTTMSSVPGGSAQDGSIACQAGRAALIPSDTRDPFIGFRLVRDVK